MNRGRIRTALRGLVAPVLLSAPLALATASAAPAASLAAPTTTSTTSRPPAPAAVTQASLYLGDVFYVQHGPVTVPGRSFTVTGVVRPYVPGQRVLLKAYVGGRLFKTVKLALKPSRRHVYGGFKEPLVAPAVGGVSVVVVHDATTGLRAFRTRTRLSTLSENVGFGSIGRFVQLVQQRLGAMHFYIPQTGVYDQGTGLAIDAYHRLLRAGTSQLLDPATATAMLNGAGRFFLRFPRQGRHAEANLGLQLLALVNGSRIDWIFPISSGKPSTPTVLGSWQIYLRTPGYLPDGMYYSSFFTGGYAIHGYDPAPDYPASHGCLRLPIVDAIPAYNWLAMGDWVDTYY